MTDTWKQINEQPAAFEAISPPEMAIVHGGRGEWIELEYASLGTLTTTTTTTSRHSHTDDDCMSCG